MPSLIKKISLFHFYITSYYIVFEKMKYFYCMDNEFLKNWDTQLKKGLLPFFVLQALNRKECYGYELIQTLKDSVGVEVTESTMYPLLIRLMKDSLLTHKWVEQTSGIPRKYYFITEKGTINLAEMKKSILEVTDKIQNQ